MKPRSELPHLDDPALDCEPASPRASRRAPRRALALALVHVAIALHVAHGCVAEETLSPLEPSEAVHTLTTGAINAGFVLLVLALLSTLLLGRFFCGWACHLIAYQDACAWLLRRLGLRPRALRSRFLVLVPLFAAVDLFLLPVLERARQGGELAAWSWHLMTRDLWERFPGPGMALFTFLVCGGLVVWFFGGKGFCTYACPYGALFGVADRFAPGRIRVTDACEGCGHCTAVCTSHVDVRAEVLRFGKVVDPGCMKCTDCVSVCPKGALYFGFPRGARRAEASAPRPGRSYDVSLAEDAAMLVVFGLSLYAFRNLYESLPFLLSVALGVLAAGTAVVLARMLRQSELRLQHVTLKRGGRPTRSGLAAFALGGAFLALDGHSLLVQYETREGARLLERAATLERGAPERTQALEASARHLMRADRLGLVATHGVHDRLGQIYAGLGRSEEAERHLTRAIELLPAARAARVVLVGVRIERGDLDGAAVLLEELFAMDPRDPLLPPYVARILALEPDQARAARLAGELRVVGPTR